MPGLVVDERSLAVRARLDVAAVAAQHDGRRAATIEHEDGLVARRRVEAAERRGQRPGQEPSLARRQLRAEIDHGDAGQFARRSAGEHDPTVAAGPGEPDAVDGRGRRTEDDGGAGLPGELECGVASLQARGPVALVGGVVLLVDDDEADVGQRRQDRQARARRRCPPSPPGSVAIRRRARRHPGPSGRARCCASRSARSRSTRGSAIEISGTSSRARRPASMAEAIAST